jgi:hypothetical protein
MVRQSAREKGTKDLLTKFLFVERPPIRHRRLVRRLVRQGGALVLACVSRLASVLTAPASADVVPTPPQTPPAADEVTGTAVGAGGERFYGFDPKGCRDGGRTPGGAAAAGRAPAVPA